jgi:homoserine O-succinyltransferase/O-acetyltransferase
MPVTINEGRVPPSWADRNQRSHSFPMTVGGAHGEVTKIALINNMPDSALEDTELQFCELLEAAALDIPVQLQLFSLPELVRGERGRQHVAKYYSELQALRDSHFDGAIITGTEPIQADLREEPYWHTLTRLLDWASENTSSTVLSCLAAHAGVLYSDGVNRNRLGDKQFGVFVHRRVSHHELIDGIPDMVPIPHSRWNEVREDALIAHGYTVLTEAVNGGVDLFVKKTNNSLFVHFQGHPEYERLTLLKEYRRDIRRFLKHERETFPTMPEGYFDQKSKSVLDAFRESVLKNRDADRMSEFPDTAVVDSLQNTWKTSASAIYRNWLKYLVAHKSVSATGSAVQVGRK